MYFAAGESIQEPHVMIGAASGDKPVVGRKSRRRVSLEFQQLLSALHVPNSGPVIKPLRDQPRAVVGEGHCPYGAVVPIHRQSLLSSAHIPEFDLATHASGQRFAVWGKGGGGYIPAMSFQRSDYLPGAGVA